MKSLQTSKFHLIVKAEHRSVFRRETSKKQVSEKNSIAVSLHFSSDITMLTVFLYTNAELIEGNSSSLK